MNLFFVAVVVSALAGMAAGVYVADITSHSSLAMGTAGLLLGIVSHGASLVPGVAVMRLSPKKGVTPSRLSNVGATLIFIGALASPVVAFLVAKFLLMAVTQWL